MNLNDYMDYLESSIDDEYGDYYEYEEYDDRYEKVKAKKEKSRVNSEIEDMKKKHIMVMGMIAGATVIGPAVGAVSAKRNNEDRMVATLNELQDQLTGFGAERTDCTKTNIQVLKLLVEAQLNDPVAANRLRQQLKAGEQRLLKIDNKINKLCHRIEVIANKLE